MTGSTARVAVLVGPHCVDVRDEPLPALGAYDVAIRTAFTGISAGTEMNVYRGRAPQWSKRRDPTTGLFQHSGQPDWTYPVTYGYAAVGHVDAIGAEVTDRTVGDLVFTYTPHASRAVVPAPATIALPDLVDPRVGVFNANLNTALNGVLDAHPFLGDVVVVSGLGVIGLLVVQLLRRAGAGRIVAVDRIEARCELARRFGAHVVLDPDTGVAETVRSLTDNRGADIVIEASGATSALNEAIRTVGVAGRVIALSWYGGRFDSLDLSGEFHHNRPRIIASQVGTLPPELGVLWSLQRRQAMVSELLPTLDLAPMLTHALPIEDAAKAYELVDEAPPDLIQCILSYDGPTP